MSAASSRSSAANPREPAEVHHARRDDRPQGPRAGQHSCAAAIDIPHFRYGQKGSGGVGQGEGEVGQPVGKGQGQEGRRQRPGGQISRAAHVLEVEITLEELADILGDELSSRVSSPRGKTRLKSRKDRYTCDPPGRPRFAQALQADLQGGAEAASRRRTTTTTTTRSSFPSARTSGIRSWKTVTGTRSQRRRPLHDGRVRLDDRRPEGDRPHRGVLDRYLAQAAIRRRRRCATSFTTRRPTRSTRTRFTTRAKAAARASARPTRSA